MTRNGENEQNLKTNITAKRVSPEYCSVRGECNEGFRVLVGIWLRFGLIRFWPVVITLPEKCPACGRCPYLKVEGSW